MNQKRDNTTPSCAVCQRRKVKCNRVYPCAACTKSGLECVFNEVLRERKRARRTTADQGHRNSDPGPNASQAAAAATASAAAAAASVPSTGPIPHRASDFPSPASDRSNNAGRSNARLIDGRYVNNHLYRDIVVDGPGRSGPSSSLTPSEYGSKTSPVCNQSSSVTNGESAHNDENDDEDDNTVNGQGFLFGKQSSDEHHHAHFLQLPANQIVYLWQIYLKNIDPIMKISHAPTTQEIVLGQIGRTKLPKNEEALIAAVYFVSTVSLTDEECHESLHDSRASLLRQFRDATENAMSAAGFVTSTDLVVLQALIFYLAGLRSIGEMQYVWSLMGLTIRIAGTIGLARDGSAFDLSPFDVEMRRRLWWSLVYFDGRMAEVVGQDGDLMGINFDARPPSNLNDADLFPSMKRLPNSRSVPTESIYLQARNLCLTSARELQNGSGIVGTWQRLQGVSISMREKQRIMENIERRFQSEIIRTCDPTVPLQWISINTANTFMAKLRLVSRIPIVHLDQEWEAPDGYSDNAFLLSMQLMQHQLDLWSEPGVQQWRWHWQAHFQWYALTCLLRQTRLRHPGPDTSKAWGLIKRVFEVIIPSLELGPKKSVLLDGIHALLNVARTSQHPQIDPAIDDRSAAKPKPEPDHHAPDLRPMPPQRQVVPMFSSGYGAAPHSALLPGMSSNALGINGNLINHDMSTVDDDHNMLGFDLDAIDWAEFDRLAAELIQQ